MHHTVLGSWHSRKSHTFSNYTKSSRRRDLTSTSTWCLSMGTASCTATSVDVLAISGSCWICRPSVAERPSSLSMGSTKESQMRSKKTSDKTKVQKELTISSKEEVVEHGEQASSQGRTVTTL